MMVTVELKQIGQDAADLFHGGKREWYYKPVNQTSADLIAEVNWGTAWFFASERGRIEAALRDIGVKITSRWYHISTKRQIGF